MQAASRSLSTAGSVPTRAVAGPRRRSTDARSAPGSWRRRARCCSGGTSKPGDAVRRAIAPTFGAGTHRITITGTSAFRPVDLLLTSDTATVPATRHDRQGAVLANRPQRQLRVGRQDVGGSAGTRARRPRRLATGLVCRRDGLGEVETSFRPGRTYRVVLAIGAAFLAALVLVALVPRRTRKTWPTTDDPRRTSAIGLLTGLAVVAGITAGVPGLLAAGVGHVTARLVWRGVRLSSIVAPMAVLAAGLVSVVRPWDGPGQWAGDYAAPQLLVLVALSCLVPVRLDAGRPAFLRRRNGRSTKRYNTSDTTRLTDKVNAKTTARFS